MKHLLIAITITCITASTLIAGNAWDDQVDGVTIHHIANGHISIGIAPEHNGRLVDLRFGRDGANLLRFDSVEPDYGISLLKQLQAIRSASAPSPWRHETNLDATTSTSSAQLKGTHCQLTATLTPQTSTLQLRLTLTNTTDHHLDLAPELSAWFDFPKQNIHSWYSNGASVEFHKETDDMQVPAVAKEATLQDGWFALRVQPDLIVLTKPQSGAAWPTLRREYSDHSGELVLPDKPAETPPGGTVTSDTSFSLYKGLTGINLADGTTLFQMSTEKPSYKAGEAIVLRIGAARPTIGKPVQATITYNDKSFPISFACRQPGVAEWKEIMIGEVIPDQLGGFATLKVNGHEASLLIHDETEPVDNITQRRLALHRQIQQLSKVGTLATRTEAAMGRVRLLEIDRKAALRQIADIHTPLDALETDVARWLSERR